jgi:hypothetical protein
LDICDAIDHGRLRQSPDFSRPPATQTAKAKDEEKVLAKPKKPGLHLPKITSFCNKVKGGLAVEQRLR